MTQPGKRSSEAMAPWAVLIAFLLITAVATNYVFETSRVADRAHFNAAVQTTSDAVQFRLETYANVLRAAAGLFAANRTATRDEFRDYVRQLEVQQRYPGIQGVGLTVRIRPHDIDDVVSDLRANEFPDFHIWPVEPLRDEYHAIVVLEPLDRRNRAAIGYDMFTEAVRRKAMAEARDRGMPIASGRVRLVQEIDPAKQPGFLLYVPVYNSRVPPPTVDARRQELYGFVYAPFRAYDFFQGIVGRGKAELGFAVYDGGDLLYVSDSGWQKRAKPRYTATSTFHVAGREWRIAFQSSRQGGAPLGSALATALSGIAIGVLLFALLRVQLRARTEAELTAERLRESEAGLQAANRAKDEFLATLSHELRTPMTAIMGWSKLLDDHLDEETYRTAVESIQRSSKAQAQLIDDLLDVSRITAGKMRIEPKPVELGPIAAAAAAAVTPAAESRGVKLELRSPSAPMLINGDSHRLQQVIWNLLSNAVKFTPSGGRVDVEMRQEDGEGVISVTDTGRGIEPDFLPHVFERFRQADSSTTRSYTGLGLGLAIVRHLVELHRGRVTAESEGLGKGARFSVRLPLLEVGPAKAASESGYDPNVARALTGAHILLVDDEEAIRNYGGAVFRMSGAEVRCVKSAADALEALQRKPVDVVVTDIGMPEMDGYELLRRIRASSDERIAGVPVVALTAYARPEDRDRSEQAGFEAFVSKPVDPAVLRAEVARVLRMVRGAA